MRVYRDRFHTRFRLSIRAIIDTNAASRSAADCRPFIRDGLGLHKSRRTYPPATRMHVNANVYCLGTGSRFNRKYERNGGVTSPSRALQRPRAFSHAPTSIRLSNFANWLCRRSSLRSKLVAMTLARRELFRATRHTLRLRRTTCVTIDVSIKCQPGSMFSCCFIDLELVDRDSHR